MKKNILLYLFSFATFFGAISQSQFLCGTDQLHQYKMQHDSVYAQKIHAQDNAWAFHQAQLHDPHAPQALISTSGSDTIYEIPVVFHIIHTGQAIGTTQNPSDATVQNWITQLNASYAATGATGPSASNGGVNTHIQFVLAKRTPNCQATNGIVRVDGSGVSQYSQYGVTPDINQSGGVGAPADSVSALSYWGGNYINIYFCTQMQLATGFSYIGGDRVFLLSTYMNWVLFSHEVGHALSLKHTFAGANGATCPVNTNCSLNGDGICDTDPIVQGVSCTATTNPCTGGNVGTAAYNYMYYSSCQNRFTVGQKEKMIYNLIHERAALLYSWGGVPVGNGNPPIRSNALFPVVASCYPAIHFPSDTVYYDRGVYDVTFADMAYHSYGFASDGYVHYIDHTIDNTTCLISDTPRVAYLLSNTNYTLSVGLGIYTGSTKAWIDWNSDGIFQNIEQVLTYSYYNYTGNANTASAIIAVPSNAVPCTPLRMRVVCEANTPVACGLSPSYGQTEDFTVIVQSVHNVISQAICAGGSFNFNGTLLTSSGTYTDTLTSVGGCDSIVTLNLSVKNKTTSSQTISVCNSYFFNGANRTTSGTYYDTLANSVGCDSLITLNLTIKLGSISTQTETVCGSYFFNGANRTQSGTYYDTLINSVGCDSFITLNLTVKQNTAKTLTEARCFGETYTFNGNVLHVSGTYFDTLPNSVGCDSVVTLLLSFSAEGASSSTISSCDFHIFNGDTLSKSGVYVDTLQNVLGCDSVVTLNLTVDTIPVPVIEYNNGNLYVTDSMYTSYQWYRNGVLISGGGSNDFVIYPTQNGNYSVRVSTVNGCYGTSDVLSVDFYSVSAVNANKLNIYPNPSTGKFELVSDIMQGGTIEIFDLKGEKVFVTNVSSLLHTSIDISGHAKGIYIMKVANEENVWVGKVVKE